MTTAAFAVEQSFQRGGRYAQHVKSQKKVI